MKRWFLKVMGWLAALMIPLCAGGLWSVLMLVTRYELPWFALVIGALAWLSVPYLSGIGRLGTALGCGLCSALGMAYAHGLAGAADVSRLLGVDFGGVVSGLGVPILLDLAWVRSAPDELLWMATGVVLAAAIGWRRGGLLGRAAAETR